eukprot:757434-Pleurochrysis_carterae.AAC.1
MGFSTCTDRVALDANVPVHKSLYRAGVRNPSKTNRKPMHATVLVRKAAARGRRSRKVKSNAAKQMMAS